MIIRYIRLSYYDVLRTETVLAYEIIQQVIAFISGYTFISGHLACCHQADAEDLFRHLGMPDRMLMKL
jgi:hypothetical protein